MGPSEINGLFAGIDWIEATGWIGALGTLAAYAMRTMVSFRIIALLANVFFLLYGFFAAIYPTLALHIALIGLNGARLWQIYRDTRMTRGGAVGTDWMAGLKPLMKEVRLPAGTRIFARGDAPDHMYLISAGDVRIEEIGKTLGPGEMFGEIGFFTDARQRTMSATCATDCRLLVADEAAFIKAYYQSPQLGLAVLKLVASRLHENAEAVAPA